MKPINIHQSYELGWQLQTISNTQVGDNLAAVAWNLFNARMELMEQMSDESVLPQSSKRAAGELINAITVMIPQKVEDVAKIDQARTVAPYEAYMLRSSLDTFATVLGSDCPEVAAYFVEKKGTHNTDDLINRADHMFSEQVRDRLPEAAKQDLKSAGTCLAFDLYSAAGFHLVRAIESVIRKYCFIVSKKQPKSRNWAAWIEVLERSGADVSITAMLGHIRETYRNTLIHPELVLDVDDAMVILGLAQSAILLMIKDIEKRQPAAKQTALAMVAPPE